MVDVTVIELKEVHLEVDVANSEYHVYSISASGRQDYVDENREYIVSWINRNADFPLQFVFSSYTDQDESDVLNKMRLAFTSEIYGTYDAAMKYYFVKVDRAEQLVELFERYFYLAAQNEFMLVMDARSTVKVENKIYKKKKAYPVVTCTLYDENSYGITIEHDGQGMQLFTMKQEWINRDGLMQTLGDVHLEQWDEEYYGES